MPNWEQNQGGNTSSSIAKIRGNTNQVLGKSRCAAGTNMYKANIAAKGLMSMWMARCRTAVATL